MKTIFIIIILLTTFSLHAQEKQFKKACEENSVESFDKFIKKYPNCIYTVEAEFNRAVLLNTSSAYEDFITKFPSITYTAIARCKLCEIIYMGINNKDVVAIKEFFKKFPYCNECDEKYETDLINGEFNIATTNNTVESYKYFINEYPGNIYQYDAENKLQTLIAKQEMIKEIEELIKKIEELKKSINIVELYNLRSSIVDSLKPQVESAIAETENNLITSISNNYSLPVKIYPNDGESYKYSFRKPDSRESAKCHITGKSNMGESITTDFVTENGPECKTMISTDFKNDYIPIILKPEMDPSFEKMLGYKLQIFGHAVGDMIFLSTPTSKEFYYDKTLWRFYGNIKVKEYSFSSSDNTPICFYLKNGVGAIYLYGKGQIYQNGKLIKQF